MGHLLADHPARLTEAMAAGGEEAKRAFTAMMEMRKIDVAAIEAAPARLTARARASEAESGSAASAPGPHGVTGDGLELGARLAPSRAMIDMPF